MVQLAVGMLGSIMVASVESLVIDDEMCGAILRSVRGVNVSEELLDPELWESVVTGDGHYLGQPQTLELMRSEYLYPVLGDRSSVQEWVEAGEPSMWEKAHRRVRTILDAGPHGHLSAAAEARIRDAHRIVAR
jgi:trimethylamine--corrinoid protein Co-methyltransferase